MLIRSVVAAAPAVRGTVDALVDRPAIPTRCAEAVLDDLEVEELFGVALVEPAEPFERHRQLAAVLESHSQPIDVDLRRRGPLVAESGRLHQRSSCHRLRRSSRFASTSRRTRSDSLESVRRRSQRPTELNRDHGVGASPDRTWTCGGSWTRLVLPQRRCRNGMALRAR